MAFNLHFNKYIKILKKILPKTVKSYHHTREYYDKN